MTEPELEIELSCGPVRYVDRGQGSPTLVFLHGLTMDRRVWTQLIAILSSDFRCIAPTLPEGAHVIPTRKDFVLSPASLVGLIGEFIDQLRLHAPVLVENDSGRAQEFAARNPTRLGGLVAASCETAGNFPPGLAGKMAVAASRVPGAVWLQAQLLKLRTLRHSSIAFGRMSSKGVDDELLQSWLRPLQTSSAIRKDFVDYLSRVEGNEMDNALEGLRSLACPALIVWGAEDRFMPEATGRALAAAIPKSRFELIPGSGTLIPLDQPARLAASIARFARETVTHAHEPSLNRGNLQDTGPSSGGAGSRRARGEPSP